MAIQKVNLLLLNSIKNLAQFAVGFGLAVATFGYVFSMQKVIFAALGLVLTYASAYIYNDLVDLAEDKKDEFKLKFKVIARGDLKIENAKILVWLFLISGLFLSFLVGFQFIFTIILLLIINFIYSSPYTHFRDSATTFTNSIFLLEFLKFSTGWLAAANTFVKLPMAFIASMSMLYIFFGHSYRKKIGLREICRDHTATFATTSATILFLISVLIYSFKIQLIIAPFLIMLIAIPRLIFGKKERFFEKIVYSMIVAIIVLFMIATIFFATPTGVFNSINKAILALI